MKSFRKRLTKRQIEVVTALCVGLDFHPDKIPACIRGSSIANRVFIQAREIIDATAEHACMFKPQEAHYEAIPGGKTLLRNIVDYIHNKYPDIPVFLDCKRGDIGSTQDRYGVGHLNIDDVDGMNYNPWMGRSTLEPLAKLATNGQALVGLCYTSNHEGREMQDVIMENGSPYWTHFHRKILEWSEEYGVLEDAGAVMGACYGHKTEDGEMVNYFDHMNMGRDIDEGKLWYLIPGIGAQGGFIEETINRAYRGPGSLAINSSRGIIFASLEANFAEAAAIKAKQTKEAIESAIRAGTYVQ